MVCSHVPVLPKPTPIATRIRNDRLINLNCPNYGACLDVCVRNGWDSWTCRQCPYATDQRGALTLRDFAHDRRRDPMFG